MTRLPHRPGRYQGAERYDNLPRSRSSALQYCLWFSGPWPFAEGLEQMLDKTHKRFSSISTITEDPAYHQRLYDYILVFRKNTLARQMVRETGEARNDKAFLTAEHTFGTLPSVFCHFNRLPTRLSDLLKHRKQNPVINQVFCDRHVVEQIDRWFSRVEKN